MNRIWTKVNSPTQTFYVLFYAYKCIKDELNTLPWKIYKVETRYNDLSMYFAMICA